MDRDSSTMLSMTFKYNNTEKYSNYTYMDNSTNDLRDNTSTGIYIFASIYILMSCLGLILNNFTIAIIANGRHLTNQIKIQLINLAVADFLTSFFIPADQVIFQLQVQFPDSRALCTIIRFVGLGAWYISPLWNAAISIERFVIIYFPLKMKQYTRTHKLIMAVIVWSIGLMANIHNLLYSEVIEEDGVSICSIHTPLHSTSSFDLYEWLLTTKYLLPPLVMTTMYTAISVKLLKRRSIGESTLSTKRAEKKVKVKRKQVCYLY